MTTERVLHVLLADDEEVVRSTIGDYLRRVGHCVEEAEDGQAAVEALEARDYDVALVDLRMPRLDGLAVLARAQKARPEMPVVMITGHGTMETVIETLRLGAADFLTKPIRLLELDAVLEKCIHIRALREDKRHLRETIRGIQVSQRLRAQSQSFIGVSAATRRVRDQIRQAVNSQCDTILITGETGTGKEIVAGEVHFQACADEEPFIAVSCPALPDSLLESALFGHMKGAFTGAMADQPGYFEMANGGTLFLDEVADLSAAAQAKLLRVLETRTLRRLGSAQEIAVDIRVVAATNTALEELVKDHKFRPDLFYRLNAFSIHLTPLRTRPEDIVPMAEHFLGVGWVSRIDGVEGFSAKAKELLRNYDYPGNARELRSIVERAAILCGTGLIQAEHLAFPESLADGGSKQPVQNGERARILDALKEAEWNRRLASKNLGMPYSTLRYKIKTLGIAR